MPDKNALRSCPVCSWDSVEILHHQRFVLPEGHPLPTDFDIVLCKQCGMIYADTAGSKAAYDCYYAEYSKYSDQSTSTGGGGNAKDQARLEVTASTIVSVVPDRRARIVDVGCANGGLLAVLKSLGYTRLFGVDPSLACVANARQLFGLAAEQGSLTALPNQASPANLIIVSHVLEHVLDLRGALEHLRTTLAPDGLIYAEVPDADRYVDCLAAPFQDFNTEHINHFNEVSLANLFAACGFERVKSGRKTLDAAPGALYPALYGVFRLVERPHGALTENLNARPNVQRYIDASRAQLAEIETRLHHLLKQPIIIWGTGQLALKLLAETSLRGASIVAFTDGNPLHHGKTLHGVPIIPPEQLAGLPRYPIVLVTLLHHDAISCRIRGELKLTNKIVLLNNSLDAPASSAGY